MVLRTLGAVLLLALMVAGGAAALLWWTVPAAEAELRLPGLSAPVAIDLDPHGIARIRAESETDAAMALGLLHARDRLFQMDSMRRAVSGRLSELAGPASLRLDRTVRTLGLARRAEADLAALPPDTRALLDAYAAGVNAWIAARGRLAAPEFLLLGAPEPWTPRDSLLWAKLMGVWLSGNWQTELARARLLRSLPPERVAELWPTESGPPLVEASAIEALRRGPGLDGLLAALPQFPGDAPLPASASNAWAVAPSRSVTGGALLASDPHLGFQAPILWYLARIELPGGRFLAGATSPGVPFLVIGRNERVAWGFTTTHSDTQDVFIERPAGPGLYDTPDGPRPFDTREELIAVRGQPPERLLVRETRHGPVVSDLDDRPDGPVLAVSMANLAPGDSSAAGLHALNRARDLGQARAAASRILSPAQNLMVADAQGGIGLFLTGRTPIRRAGDGAAPVVGWDGAHDWTGWVPFDDMPHLVAPASGAVANANNRLQPEGGTPFLGRDWPGDWRFRRIAELLAARSRHAPGDMAAMQMDSISPFARESLSRLRALPRPDGPAGAARDLLLSWDGEMTAERPQPLIFNAWWPEFGRLAMESGGVPPGARSPSAEFVRFVLREDGAGRHWCGTQGCDALALEALRRATAALSERFGPDPAAWRWSVAHVARFEHPLLRFLPVLGDLTAIAVPTAGDGETVNRGGMRGDFGHVHGAGLRLVADLSSPDGVMAIIGTGQSGHPLSPHWADLNPGWAAGRMLSLGREAERRGGITLRPE